MWTWPAKWTRFWFEPAEPANLGICRMIFFGMLFLFYLPDDFSAWAEVSDVFWMPITLFRHLHLPVLSGNELIAIQVTWKVALGLSCIGLFSRFSTIMSFILGTYLLGLAQNFGKVDHNDSIVVLTLGVMALSRCGDGWSLDGLIRSVRRGEAPQRTESSEYTWPVKIVWLLFALIFFGSGVSKIRHGGAEWIFSDSMAIMLILHNYHISNTDHPLMSWGLNLAQHAWLCRTLAAATVITETGYFLALFSRRARLVFVPSMFFMLIGFRVILGPSFYQFLICNVFWIPGDRIVAWFAARARPERRYALFFDGGCGLCDGTVAVIRRLDVLQRVEIYDVINDWPVIKRKFPTLEQNACLIEIHIVTPNARVLTGFDTYRALAWVLPVGWLLLPFLYLPGVRWIGRHVYTAIAARRRRESCMIPALEDAGHSE